MLMFFDTASLAGRGAGLCAACAGMGVITAGTTAGLRATTAAAAAAAVSKARVSAALAGVAVPQAVALELAGWVYSVRTAACATAPHTHDLGKWCTGRCCQKDTG